MIKSKIGAVIVAGGLSSRMKDFKPLLAIGNKTMIETTIKNFQSVGVDEIVIVTGYRSADIEKKLIGYDVNFVKNEKYESTYMFDSICIGLKELAEKVDLVFILPSDSPFVQQYTLKKMMEEMRNLSLNIIQPNYEGKNGHPILLRKKAINTILEHDGTMGLQGAITKMGVNYKNMTFVDPGIIMDADTINDYLNLIEYNKNKNCPSVELCEKIQDFFHMSDALKAHSNKVTAVALNMCQNLYERGIILDKKIVMAASMLHDIGKGNQQHAKVGAQWLLEMGYEEISKIVGEHMELDVISKIPTEKEVVCLADKLVRGDNLVTIKERFSYKEEFYKYDESAIKVIEKRKEQAMYLYCMIFES
jgi:putative nucleotidyltransferase with HDIG domain